MSDTCIVCLGDLSKGNAEVAALSTTLAKSPRSDGNQPESQVVDAYPGPDTNAAHETKPTDDETTNTELIAHLQPCGHDLHNECLAPWVERANSCPICRQSFNLVELCNVVGGPVISSYIVEERTQVADLDPSMFLEIPEDEDEDQPCQACGEDDNEDVLMYCDGCGKMWHTYCVGLQEVPYGHWFCDHCRAQRETDPRQTRSQRSATRSSRRRTRGAQRHLRAHRQANDSGWTRVWQSVVGSVWDLADIDLDFPFDEDDTSATYMRRHRQRTEASRQAHDAWVRRMHVAELNGAAGPFRETEPALLEPHNNRASTVSRARKRSAEPETETTDEMMAWHAFDQARAAETQSKIKNNKKRKSAPTSPEEPEEEAGPVVIKRRRTSTARVSASEHASPSHRVRPSPSRSPPRRVIPTNETNGPSFLQSLLQEVEDSSIASRNMPLYRPSPRNAQSPPAEQHSPQPSSPALSPLPSNHSSPRAMSATPPPPGSVRPSSPTGLSSSIQPVFPPTEYSPLRGSPEPKETSEPHPQLTNGHSTAPALRLVQPMPRSRLPRMLQDSPPPSRPRSHDASPTRANLSYTAKADVQKLVSAALKPHYNEQTISKDQYTMINRDISRMLYDKIGDIEALGIEGKAKWEKVAGEEVNKAVGALKSSSTVAVASS